MRRRKIIIGLALVILCAALVAVFWDREPVYAGKKLHLWAESAATNKVGVALLVPPADYRELVESIGSDGIPYYLAWLGYKQGIVTKAELYAGNRCNQWFSLRWKLEARLERRAQGAVLAFAALGTNGQRAIPILLNYATNSNSSLDFGRAIMCLAAIGRPAIPALISLSTNNNYEIRNWSISKMTRQWDDERVVAQLTLLLQHADSRTRALATNRLAWVEAMKSNGYSRYVFPD